MHKKEAATAIGCRSGGIRIVLFLLGIPIFLFLLVLVVLWIPLPGLVSEPGSKERNLMAAISVGILGLGFLVALFAYLRKLLKIASHCMDEFFERKGLIVSKAYGYGRSFRGIIKGVPLEGLLLPSYYLQPWRLHVAMHKKVGFVGGISNRNPIMNRYCKPYHLEGSFSRYFTVSTEPEKMNQFLSDPGIEKAIHTMLTGHTKQDTWQLQFYENKIEFHSIQYVFYPAEMEISLDGFFSMLSTNT
ncbi:MAG: hypothetical protein PHI40_08675 [Caldisericia bacterium]|nr:hypothetical protein [Caldisericia bacterium]MDD4615459.1 hypothetical protein [Caldisericia bacterium]